MKKKKNSNCISINKFLRIYYGISDENLLTGSITHNALKHLIPELKRLPFDYAYKNKNLIASGDIILVNDCNGNIIPYESPQAVEDIEDIFGSKEVKNISKEEQAVEDIIFKNNVNLHELSELCKIFKKEHRIREYRVVYRMLRTKKQQNIKTKKYRMRGYKNEKY